MDDPHASHPDASTGQPSPGRYPFAPGSPFAEFYLPPRLGIIHLLAWTAATAVLLKFSMAMETIGNMRGGSLPSATRVFQQIIGFVFSTAVAAGIVGTCILLLAKARRAPGRLQPGHWLLLMATATSLLYLLCWAFCVLVVVPGFFGDPSTPWILVVFGLDEIICSGMYFVATLACRDNKRWKLGFATLAAVNFMRGISYLGDYLGVVLADCSWLRISLSASAYAPLAPITVGLVLLLVVLVDLRRGPRRDWLHWLGVTVIAVGVLVNIASWVWWVFALRLTQVAVAA